MRYNLGFDQQNKVNDISPSQTLLGVKYVGIGKAANRKYRGCIEGAEARLIGFEALEERRGGGVGGKAMHREEGCGSVPGCRWRGSRASEFTFEWTGVRRRVQIPNCHEPQQNFRIFIP